MFRKNQLLPLYVFQLNAQRHPRLKYYQNLNLVSVTERRSEGEDNYVDYSSGYHIYVSRPPLGISRDLRNTACTNEIAISFSKNVPLEYSYINRFPNQTTNRTSLTKTFSAIRYDVSKRLNNEEKTVTYYLGVNLTGYLNSRIEEPLFYYKTAETNLGVLLSIIPRVNLTLTRKIQIAISSLVSILDFRKST